MTKHQAVERRIIVALDYPDAAAARQFVARVRPDMCRLKIGRNCLWRPGRHLLRNWSARATTFFLT